jgi:DNA-binding beta-propeller fold protein YncE
MSLFAIAFSQPLQIPFSPLLSILIRFYIFSIIQKVLHNIRFAMKGYLVMNICGKGWRKIILYLLTIIGLTAYFPAQVHADGGAPNLAYVSGTSHDISVIDVGLEKVIATIQLAGDPHMILLNLDGSSLYVAQPEVNQVAVIATYTKRITCTAHVTGKPGLLAFDLYTNMLYAAGSGTTGVSEIDPKTCAIRHIFKTDSPVYGLAIAMAGSGIASGNTHQLWVSGTDKITVFDTQTGQTLAHIPIPDGPQYLTTPPGSTVYATTRQGSIYAIDFTTRTTRQILTGGPFGPMDYDAITGEVYVPDQKNNQLAVLSPTNPTDAKQPRQPNRVIHTQATPESVAITNDGQLGFVALRNGTVAMLDAPARQIVNVIAVGRDPHFIITGLYPPIITKPMPPSQQKPEQSSSWWSQLPVWATISILIVYGIVLCSLIVVFVVMLRHVIKSKQQK